MCELYILLAFGLGLLSGWLVSFLMSGRYIQRLSEERQESETAHSGEHHGEHHGEHAAPAKTFKLSSTFWIVFLLSAVLVLIFMIWSMPRSNHNEIKSESKREVTKSIDKADNKEIFEGLVDGMKEFSR